MATSAVSAMAVAVPTSVSPVATTVAAVAGAASVRGVMPVTAMGRTAAAKVEGEIRRVDVEARMRTGPVVISGVSAGGRGLGHAADPGQRGKHRDSAEKNSTIHRFFLE